MINFACETILLRETPRKLLKSLGPEISYFAVSCDFKGLRPALFRTSFATVRFPSVRQTYCFTEFIDSMNSVAGKEKKQVHVPRNRSSSVLCDGHLDYQRGLSRGAGLALFAKIAVGGGFQRICGLRIACVEPGKR
jgi:hypothetical protein